MELRELSRIIWKWLWLIVLATIVAAGGAYFASQYITPVYRATATLLINEPSAAINTDFQDILASERLARSYAERLTNLHVLEQVILDTGLAMSADDLEELVDVSLVRDTQLIRLSVEHPNPATAVLLANQIPVAFAERNEEQQSSRFAASKLSLEQELATIEAEIAGLEAQLSPSSTVEQRLTELRAAHSSVLSTYEELRIAEVQSLSNVIIDEQATWPVEPVRPRLALNVVLAGLSGAMLAVAVVLLIEYLDDTLKSPADVARYLKLPTLAPIPILRHIDKDLLVVASQPRSPGAEAFRALRTNIQYASIDRPVRSIVVTSSRERDGKTVIASNLAAAIAQAGKKVILIDSDLRRPALTKSFHLREREGLTDALFLPNFEQLLTWSSQIDNLKIMPSGSIPPNPAELIGSERLQALLEFMKQHVDFIIFDSPPLLAVTDAALLSARVDGVVLVVNAGKTRKDESMRAVESLQKVGANILGVVVNKMGGRSTGYYNYYYYSQESSNNGQHRRSPVAEMSASNGRGVLPS